MGDTFKMVAAGYLLQHLASLQRNVPLLFPPVLAVYLLSLSLFICQEVTLASSKDSVALGPLLLRNQSMLAGLPKNPAASALASEGSPADMSRLASFSRPVKCPSFLRGMPSISPKDLWFAPWVA